MTSEHIISTPRTIIFSFYHYMAQTLLLEFVLFNCVFKKKARKNTFQNVATYTEFIVALIQKWETDSITYDVFPSSQAIRYDSYKKKSTQYACLHSSTFPTYFWTDEMICHAINVMTFKVMPFYLCLFLLLE